MRFLSVFKKITIKHISFLFLEDLVKYKFKKAKIVLSFFTFLFGLFFFFSKRIFFLTPLSKAYNYGWGGSLFFSSLFFKLIKKRNLNDKFHYVVSDFLYQGCKTNKIKIKLFPYQIIVLKSYTKDGLGVLYVRNNIIFGRFVHLLKKCKEITSRYFIILEPSWNGYFDPNILVYWHRNFPPIGICALEPRDRNFLNCLNENLYSLPIGSNFWVDYRVFCPLEVDKEFDLIFVAAWAKYKRYAEILNLLSRAKKKGFKYKICLIGYPLEFGVEVIKSLVFENGLANQVEIYENISPEHVNILLNKSKIFILWSRFEGNNRAIAESLFAGTPVIIREDFNYGYAYPFINDNTGLFSNRKRLIDDIEYILQNYDQFSPRSWMMKYMTCHNAIKIIHDHLIEISQKKKVSYDSSLLPVTKVDFLHGMRYFNKNDEKKFVEDYEYLEKIIAESEIFSNGS